MLSHIWPIMMRNNKSTLVVVIMEIYIYIKKKKYVHLKIIKTAIYNSIVYSFYVTLTI